MIQAVHHRHMGRRMHHLLHHRMLRVQCQLKHHLLHHRMCQLKHQQMHRPLMHQPIMATLIHQHKRRPSFQQPNQHKHPRSFRPTHPHHFRHEHPPTQLTRHQIIQRMHRACSPQPHRVYQRHHPVWHQRFLRPPHRPCFRLLLQQSQLCQLKCLQSSRPWIPQVPCAMIASC